ncbi:hypothetical protein L3X38_034067 [Prunus dulcis]|uniref:Alcohol dehydrogenase-like N-terminal domain-containing protein n=1 Tax=Prunus dulcis TaxID=3755 RepID=A0AAD4VIJ7_PRUDU|nr:hypothetical protein L3X38_034067 [Prunus dulcis]
MAKSQEQQHPIKAFGWAARDSSGVLFPFNFSRRLYSPSNLVSFYLHFHFNLGYIGFLFFYLEWEITTYPLVPGHEIVGVMTEVGSRVQKYEVGDKVGVGCLVGSCQ